VADDLHAPYALAHGQCAAWDGTELVCDLPPGHDPGERDHRGHVQFDGRGPFAVVWFDADHHRPAVVQGEQRTIVDGALIVPMTAAHKATEESMTERPVVNVNVNNPVGAQPYQGVTKPRKHKLRLDLAQYALPDTLDGQTEALAKLATLAAAHEVPSHHRVKLAVGFDGRLRTATFTWESP
jgi:hypothetical protein